MTDHGERRSVIIVGAAGGIGSAVAVALGRLGWRLGLIDIRPVDLQVFTESLTLQGLKASGRIASIMDRAALDTAMASLSDEFGGIDALVNAAGISGSGVMENLPEAVWRSALDVNLTGVFLACQSVLPHLRARGRGRIVNILSIAAREAFPGQAAYCASKWGAYGLTKVLAQEVRGEGIGVTAILPGAVDTGFWDTVSGGPDRSAMLYPEAVADAVSYALTAPFQTSVDEIIVMPPKGVL